MTSWVRGRSNVLIEGHFWRFWGIWTPKCCRPSCRPPKRHFLASQRVFWAIVREIPCTGYFSRRVREKNKEERPIFHVFSQALPTADWHKIWVTCSSRGRNQLCKVLSSSVKGFWFCEGSKFDHSHWIAMSPLTQGGRPSACDLCSLAIRYLELIQVGNLIPMYTGAV